MKIGTRSCPGILLTLALFVEPSYLNGEAPDPVALSRRLSKEGRTTEALAVLERHLAAEPSDSDVRVLYGTMLSWDGRYPEAREQLERILAQNPGHGDALPALINLEIWSDHPERAAQLARDGLRRRPTSTTLLLALAKALKNQHQPREAAQIVQRLLELDPRNQQGVQLSESLSDEMQHWESAISHSAEWFSDGRTPWHETQLALKRQTPLGSVIGRYSRADRFSSGSHQAEVDFYPRIRPGTYGYVNFGVSPDANLYPRYRVGADLFQSLGAGFEGSGGYRRLGFSGNVNIYTAALSKYYGNWLFTGRTFITPDSSGTSRSFQLSARRYIGGSGLDYWGIRVGHGSSPVEQRSLQDLEVLNSGSFTFEFNRAITRRLAINARSGFSTEDRLYRVGLRHYLADFSVYCRF